MNVSQEEFEPLAQKAISLFAKDKNACDEFLAQSRFSKRPDRWQLARYAYHGNCKDVAQFVLRNETKIVPQDFHKMIKKSLALDDDDMFFYLIKLAEKTSLHLGGDILSKATHAKKWGLVESLLGSSASASWFGPTALRNITPWVIEANRLDLLQKITEHPKNETKPSDLLSFCLAKVSALPQKSLVFLNERYQDELFASHGIGFSQPLLSLVKHHKNDSCLWFINLFFETPGRRSPAAAEAFVHCVRHKKYDLADKLFDCIDFQALKKLTSEKSTFHSGSFLDMVSADETSRYVEKIWPLFDALAEIKNILPRKNFPGLFEKSFQCLMERGFHLFSKEEQKAIFVFVQNSNHKNRLMKNPYLQKIELDLSLSDVEAASPQSSARRKL